MQQAATADRAIKSLTENQAADVMWAYYKANKTQIHSDVRGFRDVILAALMQGTAAEKVFARFALNPEPTVPAPRARRK